MKVNVPAKDQRTERTNDGRRPEDGNDDCVPTSLAAICQALTGRFTSGDGLHDAVYGEGYVGMQDPARYVGLLRTYGLRMTQVGGPPWALVARAMAEIAQGHPVLLAIPSDWGDEPPHSQYVHFVAGCDVPDPNTLTAMNPWGGFYQTQSRGWWADRFAHCAYSGIWVVEKVQQEVIEHVPSGWHDDGKTLTAPNGQTVTGAFRKQIVTHTGWPPALVPLAPASGGSGTSGARQEFGLALALAHSGAIDEVAGEGLSAQLAQAMQQNTQLQEELSTTSKLLGDATRQIAALHEQLAAMQQPQPAPAAHRPAP